MLWTYALVHTWTGTDPSHTHVAPLFPSLLAPPQEETEYLKVVYAASYGLPSPERCEAGGRFFERIFGSRYARTHMFAVCVMGWKGGACTFSQSIIHST